MHPYHKETVWDHFVSNAFGQLPTDLTFNRLKAVKPEFLKSRLIEQELQAHGIGSKSIFRLRDTSPDVYNHLRGNFWLMVLDIYYRLREEGRVR